MILVGWLDSPFVRRVAVTMNHYAMPFERSTLSVVRDAEELKKINPLIQVPALILDDGEVLIESQIILDYLDETAGPEKSLTPAGGAARREVLKISAIAKGLGEKSVALNFEKKYRKDDARSPRVSARIKSQITQALEWLEELKPDPWFKGENMTQADVTAATGTTYLFNKHPEFFSKDDFPVMAALNERAEALLAFQASPFQAE
ncbi:MAG: glutathione S-transferase family protein [Rhodospirillales bacterium]|nr:glutathione S-transferase family protein [Rhodospirillales bacterium]